MSGVWRTEGQGWNLLQQVRGSRLFCEKHADASPLFDVFIRPTRALPPLPPGNACFAVPQHQLASLEETNPLLLMPGANRSERSVSVTPSTHHASTLPSSRRLIALLDFSRCHVEHVDVFKYLPAVGALGLVIGRSRVSVRCAGAS